jgi:16S rRNA (cytidine1402-2'-O)-methyltransferase
LTHTLIFFETPHRLLEALLDLENVLGDRQICAAREISKLHEEFVRGRISEVRAHFTEHEPRGEFVLVISGQLSVGSEVWSQEKLVAALQKELKNGKKAKEIAAELAEVSGWNKKEIYALVNENK